MYLLTLHTLFSSVKKRSNFEACLKEKEDLWRRLKRKGKKKERKESSSGVYCRIGGKENYYLIGISSPVNH